MTTTQQRLWAIQEARRSLARANSVAEVKRIRAAADASRLAAKSHPADMQTVRLAAELRLLCERKLGKLLAGMSLHGGDRRSTKYAQSAPGLEGMGVSRTQSSRWQREASVPDRRFRRYLREAASNGIEPTAKGLLRLAEIRRTNGTTNLSPMSLRHCGVSPATARPSPVFSSSRPMKHQAAFAAWLTSPWGRFRRQMPICTYGPSPKP